MERGVVLVCHTNDIGHDIHNVGCASEKQAQPQSKGLHNGTGGQIGHREDDVEGAQRPEAGGFVEDTGGEVLDHGEGREEEEEGEAKDDGIAEVAGFLSVSREQRRGEWRREKDKKKESQRMR